MSNLNGGKDQATSPVPEPTLGPDGAPSQPDATLQETDSSGRDERGRYARGNPGGPGNPFARNVAALRAAFIRRLTPEHMDEIAGILHEQARTGDQGAIRLLLAYSIGKPAPAVDPDRLDIEEWKIAQETAARPSDVKRAINGLPVDLASTLILAALPGRGLGFADGFKKRSKAIDDRECRKAERWEAKRRRIEARRAARAGQRPETPSTTGLNRPEAPSTTGPNGQT